MFNDSVAQYPIIAVNDGMNTGKNSDRLLKRPPSFMIAPSPFALQIAHIINATAITNTKGAAQFSTLRNKSMPRQTIKTFRPQKTRNRSEERRVGKEWRSRWPPY